jgi:pilus assembly protein CpaE
MEKPLELVNTEDAIASTLEEPMDFYMPFPINVLLLDEQKEFLPHVEANLTQCSNLTWEKTADLSGDKSTDVFCKPFNLVILVLPQEESKAQRALSCAAGYNIDIIILARATPQAVLRLAFQFGVSDFIPLDAPDIELVNALKKVSTKLSKLTELAPVLAVINAKGGSGASFIASCLAVIAADREGDEVVLLDADLHHGAQAHILGVEPKCYISDVLQALDEMDEVALKSAMTMKGKLHLLAAAPFSRLNSVDEIKLGKIYDLLWKCRQHFSQVIVDMSRGPESWNNEVLRNADILIVCQQNLMMIRETKALVQQLVNRMGIDRSKIHILVNRYDKGLTGIKTNDIKSAVGIDSILIVANDYKLASECEDLGKPINLVAKRQRMYQDLKKLTQVLIPAKKYDEKKSFNVWSYLFGK